MDTRGFLGLEPGRQPGGWSLEVVPSLCTFHEFLFGGCGLGAAIVALEQTSNRTCIWATAQYLSHAHVGECMTIDVTLAVEGHQVTQARAVGHVDGREILTVNAALGDRPGMPRGQWQQMPDAPPPLSCPEHIHRDVVSGTINEKLEQRIIRGRTLADLDGTPGDGNLRMWARIPEVLDGVDAGALAVLGDFVPMAVGQALGVRGGGRSLDNTLRVVSLVPTEWVLLDVWVHAVERGFGHGIVHMFAQDGTLLAAASQSCVVRYWKQDKQDKQDNQDKEPRRE